MKTGLAFGILAFAIYLNIFLPLACFWFCIALAIERLILNSWFVHYALHHKEHSIIICTEDGLWQQGVLLQSTYGLVLTRIEQPSAQILKEYLTTHPETNSIYIEPSILSVAEFEEVAHICYEHGLTLHLLPQAVPALRQAMQSEYRGTVNVLSPTNPPLQNPFNIAIKRLTDILFSLIILLTVFPIIAFIAYICIKKQSRGPIFKIQKMYGMNGKGFQCITFRTQHYNDESSFRDTNSPTHFPFGKFLHASRLELLPQFINVLIGTMSIVGSQIMDEEHYRSYNNELKQLFASEYQLKAGITSYRFASQTEGNSKADVWYYRNWGFWLDIRIMLHHIISLLKKSNNTRINYI
ncbi:MAG: sugar transferase [Bacteroidaceae bacterium]|nr:sugar transferase [Bacteroidaceae bacterium]